MDARVGVTEFDDPTDIEAVADTAADAVCVDVVVDAGVNDLVGVIDGETIGVIDGTGDGSTLADLEVDTENVRVFVCVNVKELD